MNKNTVAFGYLLVLVFAHALFAQPYTIHIQSPWATDDPHFFEAGRFTENKASPMVSDGNHWHTVVVTAAEVTEYSTTTIKLSSAEITWSERPRLRDLTVFGDEVWVYLDELGNYSVKPSGPFSVWFKSPWGNKIIPNMIYGSDTIAMKPAINKSDYCGWFSYTFSVPTDFIPIYFQRPHSSFTYPNTISTIDVGPLMSAGKTVFIDGTASTIKQDTVRTSKGECFDGRYSFHLYWTGNSEIQLSAGGAISNETIHRQNGLDNWYYRNTESIGNGSDKVTFNIRDYSDNTTEIFTTTQTLKEIFPKGLYDAWIRIDGNGKMSITNTPIYQKNLRFLNPWSNTSPKMILNGDTIRMKTVKNYCGWFEASYQGAIEEFNLLFTQSIGTGVYSTTGLEDGFPMTLDSIFSIADTIWIRPTPYPTGRPTFHSSFPNILGDCPVKTLAVMMFDWYDGSMAEGPYGYIARGVPQYGLGTDKDFGADGCEEGTSGGNGATKGMVERLLGPNGVPVRSATFPESKCKNASSLNSWFLPETLTVKNGITYTNTTCRNLTLELDKDGLWLGQKDDNSPEHGFFLLDDFKFLDPEKTIENPKYDSASGEGGYHNFGMTMKAVAEFEYVPGQYFEFNGDDDVWVFINNHLVVDIGGQHNKVFGSVNLDTLGLTPGETYPFHIFYAERKRVKSNFMMRTSIDLRTERSYFPTDISTTPGIIKYEIWQIVREQSLACDFSGMQDKEKTYASSDFSLFGGNLPLDGVFLSAGSHYGGITIDQGMAIFTIDTSLIRLNRSLAPGTYCLRFNLQADQSHSGEVWFTVSEYPRPSIAFANKSWDIISADTSTIGEWAYTLYPVRVRILEENCEACDGKILLFSSNPKLLIMDSLGNIMTESFIKDGHATFWILGTEEIIGAQIQVLGDLYSNILIWSDINLKMPPVPHLELAEMHDRNGDGIPDSLYFKYNKALTDKMFPNSLSWRYGDTISHFMNKNDLKAVIQDSSSFAITSDGFTKGVFTGLLDVPYFGFSTTSFTYNPEGTDDKLVFDLAGQIKDKVGPVILSASVAKKAGGVTVLSLTFSEALQKEDILLFQELFQFKFWREGVSNPSPIIPLSATAGALYRYELFFIGSDNVEVPAVGDSVRFNPGIATDLGDAHPHELNPWVRLVGEQETKITSTTLIPLNPLDERLINSPTISTHLTDKNMTKEEIMAKFGKHGHIIDADLVEYLNNLISEGDSTLTMDSLSLMYEAFYFSTLGQYVNSGSGMISCSDSIYNGNCYVNKGNIFLAWNMKSHIDRWVGSGAYIGRITIKIRARNKIVSKKTEDFVWGVQRVQGNKGLLIE